MSFLESVTEIENDAYSARVNVASDFRTFLRAVIAEKATVELIRLIREQRTAFRLVGRTLQLARQRVDYRYEHPRDAAIATYVWLLAGRDPLLARIAAEAAEAVPKLWWASQVADVVLQGPHFGSDSQSRATQLPTGPATCELVASTLETGQSQFLTQCLVQVGGEPSWILSIPDMPAQQRANDVRFFIPTSLGLFSISSTGTRPYAQRTAL